MNQIQTVIKTKNTVSYVYPIALTGSGILLAIAVLLIFAAIDLLTVGLISASVIIVFSAFVFLNILKKQSVKEMSNSFYADMLPDFKTGIMISSLSRDEVLYASEVWGKFFKNRNKKPFKTLGDLGETLKKQLKKKKNALGIINLKNEENVITSYKISVIFHQESNDILVWNLIEMAFIDHDLGSKDTFKMSQIDELMNHSSFGFFRVNEKEEMECFNKNFNDWTNDRDRQNIAVYLKDSHNFTYELEDGDRLEITGSKDRIYIVCKNPLLSQNEDTVSFNTKMAGFFIDSPLAITVVNEEGVIIESNRLFKNLLERIGAGNAYYFTDIIDDEDSAKISHRIKTTLATGKKSRINHAKFINDAEDSAEFYITRMDDFDVHGKVAVIYLNDTTEQKNLEFKFAQSQKLQAVGQLAGGIAHDFNNLLTAILGFCDLLLIKHGPGDQSFADITQIKQNASRAANLVRQLLAFSRQQTLKPKVLNLTDVLAELSNLLRRLIGEKIKLSLQHGRDLGAVKVDEGQFEQVVINLCVNARDAMPDGGKITVTTRNISLEDSKKLTKRYKFMPVADYVLLQVTDTGTGIALNIQGKIFEPFFSTKEVGKGTGLGLSTVYGIVKQTEGFIFLTSDKGQGTTFDIYLPLHKQQKDPRTIETLEPVKEKKLGDLTGRETLLLVEDEDAVRMFASRALRNKGYTVLEADSGESAIELISELKDSRVIDLVISDVVMPIMDGPTMIRKLKEDEPDLKVIFISGYAEDAFDADLDGDFNFLPKPFSLTQLAEKVKDVLAG